MIKKFLIVKLSAIGDVVHTIPALCAIRRAMPDAFIGWVVEELSSDLLKGHPYLDKLYVIPKSRWKGNYGKYLFTEIVPFFQGIARDKYDVTIDFQGLTKSGVVAYLSGAKIRIGFGDKDGRELNKIFINERITPPENKPHIIDRNLLLLKPLGIENPQYEFKINIPDEAYSYIENKLKINGVQSDEKFVFINPGAGWITKRIPLNMLGEVGKIIVEKYNLRVMLTYGPGEEKMVKELKEMIGSKALISPETSLMQLTALLSRCKLFIGGDTGPTHLASVLDVPVVSFFGASDAKRNQPYGKKSYVIQLNELECVPCWKTKCEDLKCVKNITPEMLMKGVDELIAL